MDTQSGIELEGLVALNRRRVPCAVDWCEGRYLDHFEEDGTPLLAPEHASPEIQCRQGVAAAVKRSGDGAHWELYFNWSTQLQPEGLADVARELREFASRIEEQAVIAL